MGARATPRVGVGSRPGVNVGRGVNTAGIPELGGRGAGANGGTGVSPSRGACLTTIFTTPVLFTMVGGTARGSYIEGKVEKKQETQKMEEVQGQEREADRYWRHQQGKTILREGWTDSSPGHAWKDQGLQELSRKARSLTLVSSKRKAEASGGRGGAGGRRRQHRDRGGARGRGHGLDEGHMGRLTDEVVLPPC